MEHNSGTEEAMNDMDLKIISCTDRPGSNALKVSRYVRQMYLSRGIPAEIVDLQEFPLEKVSGGPYGKEIAEVTAFRKPVVEADALVFVIPEYNGGFPGILKIFIDYLPFPKAFEKMPMAFIGESAGAFGALRAVEQFQMVANYRNALQFPERVFIQRVNLEFDEEEGLKDEFRQSLLESQTDNFIEFVKNVGKQAEISQAG